MDSEAQCFNQFTHDLKRVKGNPSSKNDAEFDALFDLTRETELLTEAKDTRDELNILRAMLNDQLTVLEDMEKVIMKIRTEEGGANNLDEKKIVQDYRVCKSHIQRVENMDIVTARTSDTVCISLRRSVLLANWDSLKIS
jgi:hypothetical protein